jgi:hypothetical protein
VGLVVDRVRDELDHAGELVHLLDGLRVHDVELDAGEVVVQVLQVARRALVVADLDEQERAFVIVLLAVGLLADDVGQGVLVVGQAVGEDRDELLLVRTRLLGEFEQLTDRLGHRRAAGRAMIGEDFLHLVGSDLVVDLDLPAAEDGDGDAVGIDLRELSGDLGTGFLHVVPAAFAVHVFVAHGARAVDHQTEIVLRKLCCELLDVRCCGRCDCLVHVVPLYRSCDGSRRFRLTGSSRLLESVGTAGDLHATRPHVRNELLRLRSEVDDVRDDDGTGAVLEKHELLDVLFPEVVRDVFHGALHAVRQSFAGHEDQVAVLERVDEPCVQHRAGIFGIHDFRFDGGEVLDVDVGAFRHVVHDGDVLLLPVAQSFGQTLLDVVAPGADQGVRVPDGVRILALGRELLQVVLHPGQHLRYHRHPLRADADFVGGDLGAGRWHRCHVHAACLARIHGSPPAGMGHVEQMVRIQRDVDVVQLRACTLDEARHAFHVVMSAMDRQGAHPLWVVEEVVLRIDDEKVYFHLLSLEKEFSSATILYQNRYRIMSPQVTRRQSLRTQLLVVNNRLHLRRCLHALL